MDFWHLNTSLNVCYYTFNKSCPYDLYWKEYFIRVSSSSFHKKGTIVSFSIFMCKLFFSHVVYGPYNWCFLTYKIVHLCSRPKLSNWSMSTYMLIVTLCYLPFFPWYIVIGASFCYLFLSWFMIEYVTLLTIFLTVCPCYIFISVFGLCGDTLFITLLEHMYVQHFRSTKGICHVIMSLL